jgi:hypothetical protein
MGAAAAGGKRRPLGFPREGGAYGVWASGTLYGLLGGLNPLVAVALAGSVASLALIEYARRGRGATRAAAILLPALPLGAVAAARMPESAPLVAVTLTMLAVSMAGGLASIVFGGGLLGGLGGFVRLAAGGGALESLIPATYLLMATGAAGLRVVGARVEVLAGLAAGAVSTLIVAGAMAYAGNPLPLAVAAVDAAWRAAGWLSGYERRIPTKRYGFLEAFRTLAVMAAFGVAA